MKAKWKDKPLEQIQPSKRQKDIAMLQQQIKALEFEKEALTRDKQRLIERLGNLHKDLADQHMEVRLFRKLLLTEVMVPTPEGFKLLTGDELREYCARLHSSPLTISDITRESLALMSQMFEEVYADARSKS